MFAVGSSSLLLHIFLQLPLLNCLLHIVCVGPLIYHVEVKESPNKKRGDVKVVSPLRIQVPSKSNNKPDNYENFDDLDEINAR